MQLFAVPTRAVFIMENKSIIIIIIIILDVRNPNSIYLSKLKYDELMLHLKELKSKKKQKLV